MTYDYVIFVLLWMEHKCAKSWIGHINYRTTKILNASGANFYTRLFLAIYLSYHFVPSPTLG